MLTDLSTDVNTNYLQLLNVGCVFHPPIVIDRSVDSLSIGKHSSLHDTIMEYKHSISFFLFFFASLLMSRMTSSQKSIAWKALAPPSFFSLYLSSFRQNGSPKIVYPMLLVVGMLVLNISESKWKKKSLEFDCKLEAVWCGVRKTKTSKLCNVLLGVHWQNFTFALSVHTSNGIHKTDEKVEMAKIDQIHFVSQLARCCVESEMKKVSIQIENSIILDTCMACSFHRIISMTINPWIHKSMKHGNI